MSDCRETTCCEDDLSGFAVNTTGSSVSGGSSGQGGSSAECGGGPSVTIAASVSEIPCNGSTTISWTSLDVGTGGTVSISPTIGSVTPDTSGSQSVTVTGDTTFVITATNACGDIATASVSVYVVEGVTHLSVSPDSILCTDPSIVQLSYDWDKVGDGATAQITADPAFTGYPKDLAVIDGEYNSGTVDLNPHPVVTTTFTITVTDDCGTYTDTAVFTPTYDEPVLIFQELAGDCSITLEWSSNPCDEDNATMEIKGPGFDPAGTYVAVDIDGNHDFDPTAYADQFIIGANNGFYAQYYGRLIADGFTVLGGPNVCAPPVVSSFVTHDGGSAYDCTEGALPEVQLDWEGYFTGNGVQLWKIVNSVLVYVASDSGTYAGDGFYSGSFTVTLDQSCTFRVYPVETCKAGCGYSDLVLTLNECTDCLDFFSGEWPDSVSLAMSDADYNLLAGTLGTCMPDQLVHGVCEAGWDRTFEIDSGVFVPVVPDGCTNAGMLSGEDDAQSFGIVGTITLRGYDTPCRWVLTFQDLSIPASFTYTRLGKSPGGEYSLDLPSYCDSDFLPATLYITVL